MEPVYAEYFWLWDAVSAVFGMLYVMQSLWMLDLWLSFLLRALFLVPKVRNCVEHVNTVQV